MRSNEEGKKEKTKENRGVRKEETERERETCNEREEEFLQRTLIVR